MTSERRNPPPLPERDRSGASPRPSERLSRSGSTTRTGGAVPPSTAAGTGGSRGGGGGESLVGRTLGPCEVLELIGEGGLGRVYRARHTRLEHEVALKVITASKKTRPEALARFKREATIAARLNHPHVARVLDTDEQDGIHYIIQELVPGTSVEERVTRSGKLGVHEVVTLGLGMASGLDSIHKAGVIHRDLKPANVVIAPDGQPKLLDFGIAKDIEGETNLTDDKVMLGTPTYLAPEQVSGNAGVGAPADLYGLGGTLYFALTGKAPLEPKDDDTLLRYLNRRASEPPPDVRAARPDAPPALCDLVRSMLAVDPADRPVASAAFDRLKAIERALPPHGAEKGRRPGATSERAPGPSAPTQRPGPPSGVQPALKRGASERVPGPSSPTASPSGGSLKKTSSQRLGALNEGGSTPANSTRAGIQGSLDDMPITEILQGVEFNQKTGLVEVSQQDGFGGTLEFQGGQPWDARTTDGKSGEEAVRALLRVQKGLFALRSCDAREGTRRIKVSFTRLLLDSSRDSDESGKHEPIPEAPAAKDDEPERLSDSSQRLAIPKKLHSTDELKEVIAQLEAQAQDDPVGDPFLGCTIGSFEVQRLLVVLQGERRYLAFDSGTEAKCLLRVFPLFGPRQEELRRLARRAEAVLHIDHPQLERCLGWGKTRDAFYAGFEPPIGATLQELLDREEVVAIDQVLGIVEDVARALKALHRRDQAHGHISPSTVRLEPRGGVVLCEAGLGRVHPTLAFLSDGDLTGMPGFVAPEVLDQGKASPQGDIYALGCLAWTLITGHPPAGADDPNALLQKVHAGLPAPRARGGSLPTGVATLVAKMTGNDLHARYPNVIDLLTDVRAVREGRAIDGFPPASKPPAVRASKAGFTATNPRAAAGLLLLACAALAGGLALVSARARSIPLDDPLTELPLPLPPLRGR